jgi:LuxR family maltose regulon positive regulatory protein
MTSKTNAEPMIRTKLHRPAIGADHLHRQHLLDRLNKRLHRPLTLVSAPAGYGKSTLVSCWLASCDTPSVWVSLDENDNDPGVFLFYFFAALQSIFPGVGREIQALLKGADLPPTAVLGRMLISNLDQINKEFICVLDDFHLIRKKAVHDLLAELLAHPLSSMHLVVVTRRDPSLQLSELRARGQMTEIRVEELRFSTAETAAFFQQVMGMQVDVRTAAAIEEKTEGWVTGLRLAALSMRQRPDLDRIMENLPDDNRYIMDYIAGEVISQQPRDIQEYLMTTSILNRFCAPLCEAVCPSDVETGVCVMTGQKFLESLQQANLFLIPLDNQQKWFRYHHLFQQLLQRQLELRLGPDKVVELHQTAAKWLADNGLIEEALHHHLSADDLPAAAQLIAHHRHDLMNREEWHRLRRWLGMLPRDVIETDPELLMVEAWLLIGWSEMAEVMDRIEALLTAMSPGSKAFKSLQGEWDTLRSLLYYHMADGPNALSYAKQAVARLPGEHISVRGLAIMLLGMSYQMIGDLQKSHAVVLTALKEKKTHHTTYHGRVLLTFCFTGYMEADLNRVVQAARQVLSLGQELDLPELIAHGYYFLGISHYERNDLVAAEKYMSSVAEGYSMTNSHNFAFSSFAMALIYQALDRSDQAREMVESVVNYAFEIQNISLLQTAQTFQAELAIRQGNLSEAGRWMKTVDPNPLNVAYRFYVPQITLVKWFLAQDTSESRQQAAKLLSQLQNFFTSTHNSRILIEVRALQALLHDAEGDKPAALTALEDAIYLAQPGGQIRPLLDLGPEMAHLAHRLAERNVASGLIGKLLEAFRNEKIDTQLASSKARLPPLPTVSAQPLSEPLTRREIEILGLLAPGLVNKEIASQLFISPETVKKHTQNIYRKLNASNRRQAVARAYELEILFRSK